VSGEIWSLKVEYLWADLGKFNDTRPAFAQGRVTDLNVNTVKVGINYSGGIIERFFGGR
jgi:opacity protein-like surface antigen